MKAAHLGLGEPRRRARVFAGSLGDSPPAGIARDVEHRREGDGEPVLRRFERRLARGALPKHGIERGRLGERNREDCPMPVDHVEAEEQRDAETAFLDRHPLNGSTPAPPPQRLRMPPIRPRAISQIDVA